MGLVGEATCQSYFGDRIVRREQQFLSPHDPLMRHELGIGDTLGSLECPRKVARTQPHALCCFTDPKGCVDVALHEMLDAPDLPIREQTSAQPGRRFAMGDRVSVLDVATGFALIDIENGKRRCKKARHKNVIDLRDGTGWKI